VHELIRETGGQVEYIHVDGTRSQIKIDVAGKGTKSKRIANLPPEVPDEVLKAALIPYGNIVAIRNEMWSKAYRYAVANGIRIVTMIVNKNIPSHMQIAGHRVLLSYEGSRKLVTVVEKRGTFIQFVPGERDGSGQGQRVD
jgi:hypothetical protein